MSATLTNGAAAAEGRDVRPDPAAPLARDFIGNLVERVLQTEAGRTACVSDTEAWTYVELRTASAAIATKISRHPSDRQRPVAIYARRQPMLVAAILGIIRSGHPFLILDPKHPPARNQRCLQLAKPVGLLSLVPYAEIPAFVLDELKALDQAFIHDLSAGKAGLLDPDFAVTAGSSFPGDQAKPE